ncbi:ER membrane protein complex subunit 4-like [Stylophora pistillata]|uniref:ER membrane protein complex subunit 4 n=1 Tax=Stylophora pistillata TaxID=50429 RepID=A0A2B4RUW5_STYPI|nr:ER membrane protein complex subunit 4-like [Stylophora pistillata]PFX20045.1 ER membrane protein complex subunit 4 [Stylophora pistillata]
MANRGLSRRTTNKWAIDLTSRPRYVPDRQFVQHSELPAPLGYSEQRVQHVESREANSTHLVAKKSWDIALGPFKQIPMNLFIMYMAGNSISIFPIMMVGMMFLRPVKALLAIKSTFVSLEGEHDHVALQKFFYLLGNLSLVALALYKCHSMGLLPTATSDWLAFMEHKTRVEYSGGGFIL